MSSALLIGAAAAVAVLWGLKTGKRASSPKRAPVRPPHRPDLAPLRPAKYLEDLPLEEAETIRRMRG